ncbi:MAG: YgiT-type zinc finger protein [Spirochaetota bacterium]|nr:YgiT-type zinc finger protein [Spirochaetota bacterium]
MECHCGGRLTEGKSSYRVSRDNFCIIIENIPAFKCTKCKKILFKAELVEKIYKLVNKTERDINEIITGKPSIHSYDY